MFFGGAPSLNPLPGFDPIPLSLFNLLAKFLGIGKRAPHIFALGRPPLKPMESFSAETWPPPFPLEFTPEGENPPPCSPLVNRNPGVWTGTFRKEFPEGTPGVARLPAQTPPLSKGPQKLSGFLAPRVPPGTPSWPLVFP